MPDLSKLSLDDLIQLRAMMMTLVEAGKAIARECPGVSFDLTPGRPARIITLFQMPNFAAHVELEAKLDGMIDRQIATIQQNEIVIEGLAESLDAYHRRKMVDPWAPVFAAPDLPKDETSPPAVPDATGAAVEPAPAVALTAAGADDETADALAKACADEDPDLDPVAPPPALVVEPTPAARATAAGEAASKFAPGPPWSEAEKTRLVDLVVTGMLAGQTRHAAATAASAEFDRSIATVQQIVKTRLSQRIEAEFQERAARKPDLVPAPEPEPTLAPEPTPKPAPAVDRARTAAVVPFKLRDVAQHLAGVTPFGKWTPQLDRDLIRLAEDAKWPLHELCLELQMTTQQAQQRLSVLTKGQTFKRAEVWAAMQAMGYGLGSEAT